MQQSFINLLESTLVKTINQKTYVILISGLVLAGSITQARARDTYYISTPTPNYSTSSPITQTQQSVIPSTENDTPLKTPSAATSPYDPETPISDQVIKPEIKQTIKPEGSIGNTLTVVRATEAQAAVQPAIQNATPEWQALFIKKLVGGDGTLSLLEADHLAKNMNDVLSIDQAVSLALENNPELKSAIEAVKSRYWDKAGAYSQYLPILQLDLARGDERSRPAAFNDAFGTRVQNDKHFRQDRVLTIRQPIIDLGFISDMVSGEDKESSSDYDRKSVRDNITSDTINAYFRLIQARMSIQLADQYKSYLDDLARRMKARVEGGGASSSDLDRIISRSSLAESARVEAASDYESSLTEFQRLTGAMPLKIRVPERLSPILPDSIQEALTTAVKQNPGYLSSLKKIDIAKDDRNRAYSGLMPRLYGQYTSGYTYNAGGSAEGNPVDGVYPTQRTDAAMLVAQWTINGGTSVAGGLSGQARARQMSMQALDIRQKMDQGIRVSYTALNASHQRLEVLQKTVEANERVVTGFEEQYKNGTRPLFDVLDAYEQLYNSRLNLMRVIFAYTQASYQVRLQMGDIVPSIIATGEK